MGTVNIAPFSATPSGRYVRAAYSSGNPVQLLFSNGLWQNQDARYALIANQGGLSLRKYSDNSDEFEELWKLTP